LGDSKGRIWVKNSYQNKPIRYYDGSAWHETEIKGHLATEDDSGRVFLLDATTIHVLNKDKWTQTQIFARDTYSDSHFLKDADGRIWFWAASTRSPGDPERPGTRGLWVFNAGKWLNYNTGDGVPTNEVGAIVPLDKDRFVIVQPD